MELVKVQEKENGEQLISARELYEFLELKERFSKWFERMLKYSFILNEDYTPYQMVHPKNNQEIQDFELKIDMAKELCMLAKNEKGKQARKYFVAIEKAWNSPDLIIARALIAANGKMLEYKKNILKLENKIEKDKPLVDYAKEVANSSDSIDMGTFAKLIKDEGIKMGRNKLFEWLRDSKFLMSNNIPYQKYVDNKSFEVIQTTYKTPYGTKLGNKTLITGKGQIRIVEKLKSAE